MAGPAVPPGNPPDDTLRCSFCGKSQLNVAKLIAGPGVYICNECIELCREIIEEELSHEGAPDPSSSAPRTGSADRLEQLTASLSFHAKTLVDLTEQLHRLLARRDEDRS